jgi:ribosome maturation factor RimP
MRASVSLDHKRGFRPLFCCLKNAVSVMKNDEIVKLLDPVVAALGLELLGVDYAPSRGNSLLRLYIDAPERPVNLDDCEAVSREVSAVLDVNDPITGHYTLEVSSPGIDRPLFTAAQFGRFIGETVKLQTNVPVGGRRRFQGPIRSVDGDTVVVAQDGVDVAIEHGNVLKANLVAQLPKPEKPGKAKTRPDAKGHAKK